MRFSTILVAAFASVSMAASLEGASLFGRQDATFCPCWPDCGCTDDLNCYCETGVSDPAPCYPDCGCPSGETAQCTIEQIDLVQCELL
ncbi:hypothetical protein BD289DRAFT_482646 [Coniella lustricola]|uniref:Extracellular membrane protein CFEM domain-containing protein n=1 Tax=Coniella lustricola TaxID=2025994 RepID=A0A2T3A865_9PEZI|nr:hypothetical protein BD289DRAFT_482646 [Coniella lustricola]